MYVKLGSNVGVYYRRKFSSEILLGEVTVTFLEEGSMMSKKLLMVLVAVLATAWMAGSASALTNDTFTKGLWHMDAIVIFRILIDSS